MGGNKTYSQTNGALAASSNTELHPSVGVSPDMTKLRACLLIAGVMEQEKKSKSAQVPPPPGISKSRRLGFVSRTIAQTSHTLPSPMSSSPPDPKRQLDCGAPHRFGFVRLTDARASLQLPQLTHRPIQSGGNRRTPNLDCGAPHRFGFVRRTDARASLQPSRPLHRPIQSGGNRRTPHLTP